MTNPQFSNGSRMVMKREDGVTTEVRTFRGWQGAYPVFETPDGRWVQERMPVSNVVSVVTTAPELPIPRKVRQGLFDSDV
jgi:hypothetical protein